MREVNFVRRGYALPPREGCAGLRSEAQELVLQRTLITLFKYPPVFDIIKGGGYYDDKYSIRPTAIRTVGS